MISSVQNIQTTLINAPDSVMGIVKGMSENLISQQDSKTSPTANSPYATNARLNESFDRANSFRSSTNSNKSIPQRTVNYQQVSTSNSTKVLIDENDISSIDRTLLNDDDMVCGMLRVDTRRLVDIDLYFPFDNVNFSIDN
jgi:hypothetical protein